MVFNGYKEEYAVATAMKVYGGSFIKGLAHALENADRTNAAKIKQTWAKEYEQYKSFAQSMEQFQD